MDGGRAGLAGRSSHIMKGVNDRPGSAVRNVVYLRPRTAAVSAARPRVDRRNAHHPDRTPSRLAGFEWRYSDQVSLKYHVHYAGHALSV